MAVRGLRTGQPVPTPQPAGPAKGVVSLDAEDGLTETKKGQAETRTLRQKTDSKSTNHLNSSRSYKITHLRRGSLVDGDGRRVMGERFER